MNGYTVFINGMLVHDAIMGPVSGGNVGMDAGSGAQAKAFIRAGAINGDGKHTVMIHQYIAGRLSRCLSGVIDTGESKPKIFGNTSGEDESGWFVKLTSVTIG